MRLSLPSLCKKIIILMYFLAMSFIAVAEDSIPLDESPAPLIKVNRDFKMKVAVVDIQSVLEGSLAVQNLRKTVQILNHKISQEITQKEREFKPLEEKLVEQRSNMGEEEFTIQVNIFNAKVNEAKKEFQARKTKLDQAHSTSMGQIYEVITTIISDLAEKYDLNLVIPATQVLYIKNKLNITSEVTSILNERLQRVVVDYKE